jgi:hypothetical protein
VSLSPSEALAIALDPAIILERQGLTPDTWQREFLMCQDRSIMLLCCRGAGKSRVVSAKAIHECLFHNTMDPGSKPGKVLIIAKAERQALEVLRYVKEGFRALGWPVPPIKENEHEIELENGARVLALPGKEQTIRVFHGVTLLVKDEASRIPDELNRAVTPMLSISKGQEVDLSTPFGQRGWFYRRWIDQTDTKRRKFCVTWQQCPRHTPEFIAKERAEHGDSWVAQEYLCKFTSIEGLVYPTFARCIVDAAGAIPGERLLGREGQVIAEVVGAPRGKPVGGIDWGFANPFAAVWGHLDSEDVLWICGERYATRTALSDHVEHLKTRGLKSVFWWADPAGATEIAEARRADLCVRKGNNAIRPGIMAVTARIESGRLKVARHCTHLIAESELYRYPTPQERKILGENPVDENNHALAALRYLVAGVDIAFMAKLRRTHTLDTESVDEEVIRATAQAARKSEREKAEDRARRLLGGSQMNWDDPELWETIG